MYPTAEGDSLGEWQCYSFGLSPSIDFKTEDPHAQF